MSTLYIEEEKIESIIIPNIQRAINSLNNAVNVGNLKVPEDFEFYSYLSQLQNKNYNSRQSIINKKNQYTKFVEKYKVVENENLEKFSEIKILNIVSRDVLNK